MGRNIEATSGFSDWPIAEQYLTFRIGQNSYGIEASKVKEIIHLQKIIRVSQQPPCVRGIIRVRGKVVPVIDLRSTLGIRAAKDTAQSCILVVQLKDAQDQEFSMGLVIDEMEEVENISAEEMEKVNGSGGGFPLSAIKGIVRRKGSVKEILDIDRAIGTDVVAQAKNLVA